MEELRELMKFGKELGFTGTDLQTYVDSQLKRLEDRKKSDRERDERNKERDERNKERDRTREKERETFESEKQARELEMLKLKADIADKTKNSDINTGSSATSSLKMPAFEENRDKLDAYLERFERFASGEKWNRSDWAIRLSALLKGKSLEVFSRLPQEEAFDYDKLKFALLKTY